MTPVERLRAAAARIRGTAEAANTDDARRPYGDPLVAPVPPEQWGALIGDNYLGGDVGKHAALWAPPVALAVADWLDGEAVLLAEMEPFVNLISAAITNKSGTIGVLSIARTDDGEFRMRAESTPAALRLADLILVGAL